MRRHVSRLLLSSAILIVMILPTFAPVGQRGNATVAMDDHPATSQTAETSAAWLTGWSSRKAHQIQGAPGAGVNYQVEIAVKFGSGIDSGNSVYCDASCQPDFDDIRFTDDDGITLLDYWRETYFESDNATFWVEVRDNLDVNVSIYMYYGNPNCSTTSNGFATFVFFDDFNDGLINTSVWDVYGPWTESGGLVSLSMTTNGSTSILPDMMTDGLWDMRDKAIVSRWRVNQMSINREWGVSCGNTVGDDHTRLAYFLAWNTTGDNCFNTYYDSSVASGYDYEHQIIGQFLPGAFMKTEFVSVPSNTTKNSWILNGQVIDTYSGTSFDSSPQRVFLGFYVHGYSDILNSGNLDIDFDYIFVRNQIGSTVTHGSWSNPESWLAGWNYRKSHVIFGSPGAGTNYQIEITVHFGDGLDSGADAYCENKCQPDFDDIRFAADDGVTLLDYWRESYFESDNATFWVEVSDSLDADVTIFMYYGNSSCTSASDGFSTFIFFDDFENDSIGSDPNPERWWLEAAQDSNDYVRIEQDPEDSGNQVAAAVESGDAVANVAWANDWGSVGPIAIGHKFRYDLDYKGYYATKDASQTFVFIEQLENLGTNNHQWYDTVSDYFDYNPSLTTAPHKWYSWEYRFYYDEMTVYDRDSDVLSTGGYCFSTVNETRTTCTRYGLRHGANTWWTDDMYVRKFVSSEPTQGGWNGLESISWHHDCSNNTGFVYNDSWNINWTSWVTTSGSLVSDGSSLTVTNVASGSGYHGPVFEYELPSTLRLRDINSFSALIHADNSLAAYLGYEGLMLGDSDRNPVLFFGFSDGWKDYRQGSYGNSYMFANGSRTGLGSGYPVTWTSFNGVMNVSCTELGLMLFVEGLGTKIITGLTDADLNREIKYVAIASAQYGSDPLLPVLVDEISLNYYGPIISHEPSISDAEDLMYEAGTSGHVINWAVSDFTPTSYELYRNWDLLTSDAWPGGTELSIGIDDLSPGLYNYTIMVHGNAITVSDSVVVAVVDTTAPILDHPLDVVIDVGTQNIQITWQPTDLFPFVYVIYQNLSLVSSGNWASGENLTYSLPEGLPSGEYNITLIVWDTSGNYAIDTVTVSIDEGTIPGGVDYLAITISAGSIIVIVIVVGLLLQKRNGPASIQPSGYEW